RHGTIPAADLEHLTGKRKALSTPRQDLARQTPPWSAAAEQGFNNGHGRHDGNLSGELDGHAIAHNGGWAAAGRCCDRGALRPKSKPRKVDVGHGQVNQRHDTAVLLQYLTYQLSRHGR